MTHPYDAGPGLYRSGDIGVSSEWRDLTLDWTPLLTSMGVSIYTYLRDLYDQQRALFPFLNPVGPLKQKIQQVQGKETDWALRGPEYLLAAIGLVQVEAGYGPSQDPDNPQRTRVAYYSIGRLTHPVLDWSMLERVLDSVMIALDPPTAHDRDVHKKASAALQSLKQAGFLQNCLPDRLFNEFGAWPRLLPTLIADQRWIQLFTSLHGDEAAREYRQQARAWVEYAERTIARLMEQNNQIRELVQEAQRQGQTGRGPRGGGAAGSFHISSSSVATHVVPATEGLPATEATRVTPIASVAAESLPSRQAIQVTPIAPATPGGGSLCNTVKLSRDNSNYESLDRDQLTLRSRSGEIGEREQLSATVTSETARDVRSDRSIDSIGALVDTRTCADEAIPLVEPHIREGELATKRLDTKFWTEVNFILYGVRRRYPHTAGEKKYAERKFYHQQLVTGVVLAALRAIVPSWQPKSFAEAVQLEVFHRCVQQALALLPQRTAHPGNGRSWPEFLQAYRTVGLPHGMRDVNPADYGVLSGLFEQHADACWEVLSRVSRAEQPVKLTPMYLKRAVANNERVAATAILQPPACVGEGRSSGAARQTLQAVVDDDPRVVLLQGEGIDPRVLSATMSLEYLQAWVAEANVRRSMIKSRVGWLIWGIESGFMPDDHPKLPKLSSLRSGHDAGPRSVQPSDPVPVSTASSVVADPGLQSTWQAALEVLKRRLERTEFDTWLRETQLELVDRDDNEAFVSTSNVFAREKLERVYLPEIERALRTQLGASIRVRVVIGSSSL